MNLHAPQVHGFFSVPVDHLTALGELANHFVDQDLDDTVVVSPDLGNAKDATQFARLLGLPVAAGSKKRLGDDRVVIDSIVGDVVGKRAIVLDDEIATGGSIVELMDRLAERGVTEASVACTHGLFAGRAVERLSTHPMIREVVTTDTVPAPKDWPQLRGPLGRRPVRRGHQAHPRGRVGLEPLRRRRPDARPAAPALALRQGARMSRLVPALLDVVLVVVFAAVGRRSHAEGLDLAGIARTALPFLVGTAAGWLLASVVLDSGPRSVAFGRWSSSRPWRSGWRCGPWPRRGRGVRSSSWRRPCSRCSSSGGASSPAAALLRRPGPA